MTLRWCNAGHPPPLLVRADGTCELLGPGPGPARSGCSATSARTDHEVVLGPGDSVLLYTDGLVETRGGDIEADLTGWRRVAPPRPRAPARGPWSTDSPG